MDGKRAFRNSGTRREKIGVLLLTLSSAPSGSSAGRSPGPQPDTRACSLRRRLDSQQSSIVLVGEKIEQTVGALPDIADPLVQVREQGFAALLPVLVEHNPLNMSRPRQAALRHRPDEEVGLPCGEAVARRK